MEAKTSEQCDGEGVTDEVTEGTSWQGVCNDGATDGAFLGAMEGSFWLAMMEATEGSFLEVIGGADGGFVCCASTAFATVARWCK